MIFAVTSTRVWHDPPDGWQQTEQVPTFLVEASNEKSAQRIARAIVLPLRSGKATAYVHVEPLKEEL